MNLESLRVSSFRNLADAQVVFPAGLTVIHGKNAQGKTNLLEAAYTVLTGHSHRATSDQDEISFGRDEAFVEALFSRPSGELTLSIALHRHGRKVRRRNGKAFRPGEDPLGDPRVILFAPEDLHLVQGAPADRRRFVDDDLGQVVPGHARLARSYQRALSQRNGALRRDRPDLLPAFDAVWAPLALRLTAARRSLVEAFGPFAARAHAGIAPGDPALSVGYLPGLRGTSEEEVLDHLHRLREEELARGATAMGPHRDDIRLALGDNDLRSFGSQGQQRTAAVAAKVAAVAFVEAREHTAPLLLLDDVLSELDKDRREALAAVVRRAQTVLTTADDGTLPTGLSPSAIYVVESGRVSPSGTHLRGGEGTP